MFTIEDLHKNVIRLVEENPDFVYQNHESSPDECLYIHPDGGGCLFGQALMATADIPDVVRTFEGTSISFVLTNLHMQGFISDDLDSVISYGDQSDLVQAQQDRKAPWALAMKEFSS